MKSAVLFIVFNRVETTSQVFAAIKKARPGRLYVAADGPRKDRQGEAEKCNKVRKIIDQIDWPCELKTLYRSENLGCKRGVSSAINWFFENETEGIILEDDVVPDQSFFSFCDEMLEYHRFNETVMMVSGTNFVSDQISVEESYFYSQYVHIWGWATWSRAWHKYDSEMNEWHQWRDTGGLLSYFAYDETLERFWLQIFNSVSSGKIDTWDYQWVFACWQSNGLCILPRFNLIKNIGFGEGATHTNFSEPTYVKNSRVIPLDFPIKHPPAIKRNAEIDRLQEAYIYNISHNPTSQKEGIVMEERSVNLIHRKKNGKVSDKWASYLTFYDDLLANKKDQPVKMLEIGIQNGGSLETWSKYFVNADIIIGCDIDKNCEKLIYDDPRIKVVIGDACKSDAFKAIVGLAPSLDLIIDDGSHVSNDVINAFISYFPLLAPGGVYVVEDAHCLYLDDFGGGLTNEFGAYAFFKKLLDVVSYKFWQDQLKINTHFRTFFNLNSTPTFITEGWIESIEFRNSLITIRKSGAPGHEKLGERLITGNVAAVQQWGHR